MLRLVALLGLADDWPRWASVSDPIVRGAAVECDLPASASGGPRSYLAGAPWPPLPVKAWSIHTPDSASGRSSGDPDPCPPTSPPAVSGGTPIHMRWLPP